MQARNCSILSGAAALGLTCATYAAPVTDFRTFRGTTATILAGQNTDDPIVGGLGTDETASTAFVIGYLGTPAVLGPNAGDLVTLSFGVHFNDNTGMNNNGDNFRFALFDLNGEAQEPSNASPNIATAGTDNTDDFRGYILGVKNGTGTGSGGSIRERLGALVSGDNAFAVTGANLPSAPSLGPVGGDPVTLTSDVAGDNTGADYTAVLTLTRNGSGLVDVSGSFIGSNGATGNVFSAADTTANGSSTYGAIGFLFGGGLSTDQASFTNIDVSIPEPTSLGLLAAAGVLALHRRRA